jgi:hypothetical protein
MIATCRGIVSSEKRREGRETHTRNRKVRSRPLPCGRVLYPLSQIREVFIDFSLLLFRVSFSSCAVIDGKDARAELPWWWFMLLLLQMLRLDPDISSTYRSLRSTFRQTPLPPLA